jgi:hypothetical protein
MTDQCGASVAHKQQSQRTPFRPILNINTATHKQYTMIDHLKQKVSKHYKLTGRVTYFRETDMLLLWMGRFATSCPLVLAPSR